MIKLFVTDLDGCISYPFRTPNWDVLTKIRELNVLSRVDSLIPPLTICTGRPYPYAEAIAQLLDVRNPFVFESAGLFIWDDLRIKTALNNETEQLEPILKIRKWIISEILPDFPTASVEFTKKMDAGVVATEKEIIDQIHPLIAEKVKSEFPELEIHITDVSVNVLISGNNKFQGMQLIAEQLGLELNEIAYIGDTGGDIPALEAVGMPFCPSNATRGVKNVSKNLSVETTEAVLAAYEEVIAYNRAL